MELIKVWRNNGFTLRLWDTFKTDSMGKTRLRYEFKDGRKVIFTGDDFRCSPIHAIDYIDCVYSLLGFLSLTKGDTDSEYFDNYTSDQIEWRDSDRRELLSFMVYEFEEKR